MLSLYRKMFIKTFERLSRSYNPFEIWKDFILMSACSISNAVDKEHFKEREDLYLRTIRRYNKDERELFPKLLSYTVLELDNNIEQDFLGSVFMEMGLGNKNSGQFFTPYHICQFMSKITLGDNLVERIRKDGYITINDSCCGAGAILIAAANESRKLLEKEKLNFQNHILIAAQDIDYTVAQMCYIQLSLIGVAGFVKVGNSLTEPMSPDDSTTNYWFTPMYFSNVWAMRRIFHSLDSRR